MPARKIILDAHRKKRVVSVDDKTITLGEQGLKYLGGQLKDVSKHIIDNSTPVLASAIPPEKQEEIWSKLEEYSQRMRDPRFGGSDIGLSGLRGRVGNGSLDAFFLVYDGSRMEFLDSGSSPFTLEKGDVIGDIGFRITRQFPKKIVEKALTMHRKSVPPGEIYNKIIHDIPASWSFVMDDIPENRGIHDETGFLALIHGLPQLRDGGRGISRVLIDHTLKHLQSQYNVEYAVAYGRLPYLSRECYSMPEALGILQEYVQRKRGKDGLHPDWGVRFHQKAGGEVVCGLPNCSYEPPSFNCGFLAVYDLKGVLRKKNT